MDEYNQQEGIIDVVDLKKNQLKVRFQDGEYYWYCPEWLDRVEESPFKVGDFVIGNKDNIYPFANKVAVCKVYSLEGNGFIRVFVDKPDPENKHFNPYILFTVRSDMFKLYDDKPSNKYSERLLVWNGKQEKVKFILNGTTTICILPNGIKGIAKCDPKDKFVKEYGEVLSYQRARYNQLYPKKVVLEPKSVKLGFDKLEKQIKSDLSSWKNKEIKVGDTVRYNSKAYAVGKISGVVGSIRDTDGKPAVWYSDHAGFDYLDTLEKA